MSLKLVKDLITSFQNQLTVTQADSALYADKRWSKNCEWSHASSLSYCSVYENAYISTFFEF